MSNKLVSAPWFNRVSHRFRRAVYHLLVVLQMLLRNSLRFNIDKLLARNAVGLISNSENSNRILDLCQGQGFVKGLSRPVFPKLCVVEDFQVCRCFFKNI